MAIKVKMINKIMLSIGSIMIFFIILIGSIAKKAFPLMKESHNVFKKQLTMAFTKNSAMKILKIVIGFL